MKKTLDASKTKKMVPYEEPGQSNQVISIVNIIHYNFNKHWTPESI